ncbi:MAG: hypothetical protein AAGF11_46855 [Myxococcota bacterium]
MRRPERAEGYTTRAERRDPRREIADPDRAREREIADRGGGPPQRAYLGGYAMGGYAMGGYVMGATSAAAW